MLLSKCDEQVLFDKYNEPTYRCFIRFVREYIAPFMKRPFVEEEFYEELWNATWRGRYTDIQIARGHGKTEFLAIWRPLFIGAYQFDNPHFKEQFGQEKSIRDILIVGSDQLTTGEIFDRLKFYLNASPILRQLMPESGEEELPDNTKKLTLRNGTTFFARSIKMKRGLHPDLIILDDLTTESSTLTDKQTWDLFSGAVMPMSTANAAIVTIDGTPLRNSDIMSRVRQTKTVSEAVAYDLSAGETNEQTEEDVWYHVHLPAIDRETGELLSNHRFTKSILSQVKQVIGSRKFEAEYMLNPLDDESSLIKAEWFDSCRDNRHTCKFNRSNYDEVYLGWDFAFSDRITADNAAGAIIGKAQGKSFLLNIVTHRGLSALEQLERIKELHAVYRFDNIGLEENSIQSVYKEIRNIEMPDGRRLPIKLFRLTAHDDKNTSPLTKGDVINVGKQNFIIRLATVFENQELVLPDNNQRDKDVIDALRAECLSWALEEGKLVEVGPHPDRPVALGYALEVSKLNKFVITW